MISRFRIRPAPLAFLSVAALLAGCAVPLGPGFHLRSRRIHLDRESVSPVRVHVRVADVVENAGNRPLAYLDVRLPSGPSFGLANLRVRMNDRELEARPASPEPDAPVRLHFDPPWPTEERRTFVFDYDFAPPAPSGVVAASAGGFHVAATSTFPQWLAPPSLFARADLRARDERFEVRVPAGYRVLAAGREQRVRREEQTALHRYRLFPGEVNPFVIAGDYLERRVDTPHGSVIFWTLNPLDEGAAEVAARRLAGTAVLYERTFEPLPRLAWPLYVIESSAGVAPVEALDTPFPALAFPRGVLLGTAAFDRGITAEPVLRLVEYGLAQTWFGWQVRVGPASDALLGRGLALFLVLRAAADRDGEGARRREIGGLINSYDRAQDLGRAAPSDTSATSGALDARKAALFLFALEDQAGPEALESALKRLFFAMVGQETATGDLRSALENASGLDLAPLFRAWLNRPGLPEEFRTHYASQP